jgi:hypothetical protein
VGDLRELITPLGQLGALAGGARAHMVGVAADLRRLTKLDARARGTDYTGWGA